MLTEKLIKAADLPDGAVILDAGCGAGDTAVYLTERGFQAVGVDLVLTEDAVDYLRRGDMTALSYGDASFDGVITECSLSVCGDAAQALAEFYRVLKPGGQLLLSDVSFAADDAPILSLKVPAKAENWRLAIQTAGFRIKAMTDVSSVWKSFVAQCIWEDRALSTLWCGLKEPADHIKSLKPGYFLLWAEK